MTGIADIYLYLDWKSVKDAWRKPLRRSKDGPTRFVVLSWKRTGSNLLCGMLHNHPEICMHNELFNDVELYSYYPGELKDSGWTVLTRDLFPEKFLNDIWAEETVEQMRPGSKAVGFKSFPTHWSLPRNEGLWETVLLENPSVKKIILHREDELAVYVSVLRSEATGHYLGHKYPTELKVSVKPAAFQRFLNNYRLTYREKYKSSFAKSDSFWITYEELANEENLSRKYPELLEFLEVDVKLKPQKLDETIKQADPNQEFEEIISNYAELEYCFRHSDVLHFRKQNANVPTNDSPNVQTIERRMVQPTTEVTGQACSWSILLPVCSRELLPPEPRDEPDPEEQFLARKQKARLSECKSLTNKAKCWQMIERFGKSLEGTVSLLQLKKTECIVGIDIDDKVFGGRHARERLESLLPCQVTFVDVHPPLYGRICKIWNLLGDNSRNDFLVLLGDDVELMTSDWQTRIAKKFHDIAQNEGLVFGAACVAFMDEAFPGFPTFPVVHRWHLDTFGSVLPPNFVNQGGDPYLYELYSRFNAAAFSVGCRLKNGIGGDDDARYRKHEINWRGAILNRGIRRLKSILGNSQGLVLDVVVPSFRMDNAQVLRRITLLRPTRHMYVKFWLVLDNPDSKHVEDVQMLADNINQESFNKDGNYFVNVVHYGENRGASYARNVGYNNSTADWVLFLDDDVIPVNHLLDAYAGATYRFPDSKVLVGLTELPQTCSTWTKMMRTCNVGYFFGVAAKCVHPPWGVTANIMVAGSRCHSTIQFKYVYPKSGGGEDVDFVFQFKEWYKSLGLRAVTSVPEAKVVHPWWNEGNTCYRQVAGWAWGDAQCIREWRSRAFMVFPNWAELLLFIIFPSALYLGKNLMGLAIAAEIILVNLTTKTLMYYSQARRIGGASMLKSGFIAFGAGTILSVQELTRALVIMRYGSLRSLCHRFDWFDGQRNGIVHEVRLRSLALFCAYVTVTAVTIICSSYSDLN